MAEVWCGITIAGLAPSSRTRLVLSLVVGAFVCLYRVRELRGIALRSGDAAVLGPPCSFAAVLGQFAVSSIQVMVVAVFTGAARDVWS